MYEDQSKNVISVWQKKPSNLCDVINGQPLTFKVYSTSMSEQNDNCDGATAGTGNATLDQTSSLPASISPRFNSAKIRDESFVRPGTLKVMD